MLVFSVWPWVLHLRSAWAGFDPHELESEVAEFQLVKHFLGIWIFRWLTGFVIVLLSPGDRVSPLDVAVGRADRGHGGRRLLRGSEVVQRDCAQRRSAVDVERGFWS